MAKKEKVDVSEVEEKKIVDKMYWVSMAGAFCLLFAVLLEGFKLMVLFAIPLFVWAIAISLRPNIRHTYTPQRARLGSAMGILASIGVLIFL